MTTSKVHTEGADIAYDHVGHGPMLLTIAGGGGAGSCYAQVAAILADEFTVVTYDRRARGRSTGDRNADLDMAQQARDAAAVIRAMGAESAFVFGNSGGANISLALTGAHPRLVKGLIAHEPPIKALLPAADKDLTPVAAVHAKFLAEGAGAAMKLFMGTLVGFDRMPIGELADPLDVQFFMAHEFLNLSGYEPDLDAIRRSKVPVVTAAGRASGEAYYARTARLLAPLVGGRYADVPGNHLAFMIEPAPFATALRTILHDLADRIDHHGDPE